MLSTLSIVPDPDVTLLEDPLREEGSARTCQTSDFCLAWRETSSGRERKEEEEDGTPEVYTIRSRTTGSRYIIVPGSTDYCILVEWIAR